jgi:single-stranded-DNA-specific exonuclease
MRRLSGSHDLIVCVDCGTLSHEPITAARCDVLVLDHHIGGETLPPAYAVVNPNRQDESGDLSYLCAAGVVFLFLVAVNRLVRGAGGTGPDLLGFLDLVALATVADVAPLTGLNRALVRQGLRVMAGRGRPGLAALSAVAGANGPPTTWSLGFALGPRINAGGRIGAADLGARLLATEDPDEAAALAARLNGLNVERRDIEARVLAEAQAQVASRNADSPLVWAASAGWHPGVVGIVAARLKEAYGRPAVVIGFDGDEGKGSGRSLPGIDLGTAIATLMREGLIARGGGHKMAAGLTLTAAQLEPAMQRLAELMARAGADRDPARGLRIDGLLAPGSASPTLARQIEGAGPYGAGAPAPRFALSARITGCRRVGANHVALALGDAAGRRLDAIAFRAAESGLGAFLSERAGAGAHVAGRLECEEFAGRPRVKLHIEDAAPAD